MFIPQHERKPIFTFSSIQSEIGKELLVRCGFPADYHQAVILIDQGTIHVGSTAALKIGQTLKPPWSFLAGAAFLVPKSIRDWVYVQIAKHRYQWFGKPDVCMVPTAELHNRFWR
jgi:predicted DCC family thiol-disulfide oxidoreductase YuxK